jgi:hypothetical protein
MPSASDDASPAVRITCGLSHIRNGDVESFQRLQRAHCGSFRNTAQSAGMLKPASKSLQYYDACKRPKESFFPDANVPASNYEYCALGRGRLQIRGLLRLYPDGRTCAILRDSSFEGDREDRGYNVAIYQLLEYGDSPMMTQSPLHGALRGPKAREMIKTAKKDPTVIVSNGMRSALRQPNVIMVPNQSPMNANSSSFCINSTGVSFLRDH